MYICIWCTMHSKYVRAYKVYVHENALWLNVYCCMQSTGVVLNKCIVCTFLCVISLCNRGPAIKFCFGYFWNFAALREVEKYVDCNSMTLNRNILEYFRIIIESFTCFFCSLMKYPQNKHFFYYLSMNLHELSITPFLGVFWIN